MTRSRARARAPDGSTVARRRASRLATTDRSLDARADIDALGAAMDFAATGRPPFSGESAFAVMMAHTRDPVVPPSQVLPGVSEDLERVILHCLAKKRDDRYPTAQALADALAACGSAADRGANRADAWWAVETQPTLVMAPPNPLVARSIGIDPRDEADPLAEPLFPGN